MKYYVATGGFIPTMFMMCLLSLVSGIKGFLHQSVV